MRSKVLATLLALAAAGPAMAATCTGSANWGSMGPPGMRSFGNSFSSANSYLDCYTFSLTGLANSFGGVMEIDPWLNKLDIDVTKVSLYSGGLLSGKTTGGVISWDDSPSNFSFGSLSAGTYTLAVSTTVARDFGFFSDPVRYRGTIETTAASVASPAPEPASFAMMLAGLVGVGAAARRRIKKA
jgi:hypothetical protein